MNRLPICLAFLTSSLASSAYAQDFSYKNVTNLTSTPKEGVGHDYIKALAETVNPANGSISVRISVPTPTFRHGALPQFAWVYDSDGQFVPYIPVAVSGSTNNSGPGTVNAGPSGSLVIGPMAIQLGHPQTIPAYLQNTVQNVDFQYQNSPNDAVQHCNYNTGYTYTDPEGHRTALHLEPVMDFAPV